MESGIILKSEAEIDILRQANKIVAQTLAMLRNVVKAGLSTWHLDQLAEELCRDHGGIPAFKGYRGYPASLCVSINEVVVHGIPSKQVILSEGDIVSVDFGVKFEGFFGDAAITIPVGKIDRTRKKLLKVTKESLERGISKVRVGNRINDIGGAIQDYVEENGFSVVRQYVGHGIGSSLHEPPEIPNFRRDNQTPRLKAGMVLAIEPMVNAGGQGVKLLNDGWTVVTRDRAPSAHFEHSVLVTEKEPIILSTQVV